MKKLYLVILIIVFLIFIVIMIPISNTMLYYDKIDRDTVKLACDVTFYDSVNNRRCCISDTDAGTTQCVRNYIKP